MSELQRKDSITADKIFSHNMISEGEVNYEMLKCLICLIISKNPKKIECCDIICCTDCITGWLAVNNSCPLCRKSGPQISHVNKFILRVYDTLKFHCIFNKYGCKEDKIPYKQLEYHITYCEFNPEGKRICKKCSLEYSKDQIHDCLKALVEEKGKINEQILFFEDSQYIKDERLKNLFLSFRYIYNKYRFHEHGLCKTSNNNGHRCNAWCEYRSIIDDCYYCYECDFDMCISCFEGYKHKPANNK